MATQNPSKFHKMLKRQVIPLDLMIAEIEGRLKKESPETAYSKDAFVPGKFINHYDYKKGGRSAPVDQRVMLPESESKDNPKKARLVKPNREIPGIDKMANVIKVPEEQLDSFMERYESATSKVSSEFLSSVAPVFLAFENAMSYSTVAMRDGLSFDNEIDLEIMPLLEWSTRICTLEIFLKELPLDEVYRDRIIRNVILRAVEKCFGEKRKGLMGHADTENRVAGIVTSMNKEKADKAIQGLKDLAHKVNTRYAPQSQHAKRQRRQSTVEQTTVPTGSVRTKGKR
jgi:hypothetical protein